ncbi:MAG: prepilin-type N-terminal cleavage/methylation domain-containing protein [Planctomycetota bacterium]|jgi:prepilin-type N-terminal cleavage/methylation domain-containing protein
MAIRRIKRRTGLTMIEIMVTIAVLLIVVVGTSAFRYHAVLGARQGEARTTAARMAQMLCESWRGASDPNTFNPVTALDPGTSLGQQFSDIVAVDVSEHGPSVADGFTLLGYYRIVLDDNDSEQGDEISYWTTLAWQDVASGLRALNIVVGWDARNAMPAYYWEGGSGRTFKVTTYIAN